MEQPVGMRAEGLAFMVKRWIFPIKRSLGTWAFVFNRWSGILLVIYLYVHLGVLTTLAFGATSYDQFLIVARSPLGLFFDVGLTLLLLYHGLNGFRIVYAALAGKMEQHKGQFWAVAVATVVLTLYGAFLIFSLG
jgi:succinate dehydrogenase / fumarate reductase cytochrome b subunit